jgi:DNA-binding NtrC family response regulator
MVIVIEDDTLSAWALSKVLEDAGYTTITAETGETIVKKIGTVGSQPVAIISDYHLGHGINGIEAAKKIADIYGCAIPTIVTSHRENSDARGMALTEGFLFCPKPMDPEHMLGLLESAIEAH